MDRTEALALLNNVRLLAQGDAALLRELDTQLSFAEQSTLRSHLRGCGKHWATDLAFVARARGKGAS